MKYFLKIITSVLFSVYLFPLNLFAQFETDTLYNIGVTLENSVLQNDTATFCEYFDNDEFIRRIFANDSLNNLLSLDSSAYYAVNNTLYLPVSILQQLQSNGNYNFIKYYTIDEYSYLLFRYYHEGAINYHRYLLTKTADNYKIIDLYVFFTGEYFSRSLFNVYNDLSERSDNNSNLSFEAESDIFGIKLMQAHIRNANYQYALNQYFRMSENLQVSKQMMLYRILITQNLTEEDYSKTLSQYQELFPNDPSLFLLSIDGYILQKRFDDALISIDSLDSILGGDDFLDYYRANIYYLMNDFKNSEVRYSSLINNYPNFYDGYESLLFLFIEQEKFAQAVSVLENITTKFNLPKDQLVSQIKSDYQKFSKSREFRQWEKFD